MPGAVKDEKQEPGVLPGRKAGPAAMASTLKLETLKPWVCNSKGERRCTVNDHYTVGPMRVFTVFKDSLVVSMYSGLPQDLPGDVVAKFKDS